MIGGENTQPKALSRARHLKKSLQNLKLTTMNNMGVPVYTQRMMIYQVFYNYFLRVIANIDRHFNFGEFDQLTYIDR